MLGGGCSSSIEFCLLSLTALVNPLLEPANELKIFYPDLNFILSSRPQSLKQEMLRGISEFNILINPLQIKPLFIEPGSPRDNGCIESFNEIMRDKLLNGGILYTLKEARVLIEMWRKVYNTIRPLSSLDYRPPMPEAIMVPSTRVYQPALT